ncbi:MAG: SMC family ATPase [Dehalococcoidales bacterium]|nr:SMC family ATPase [Dehalococcoidales bacterium]
MIPIKLAIRNFMPYRDNVPVLDFTGVHTVSICGNNGNGKSAIIDAMTWALWGETRAKRDDELIHQGQNETEVEFEFAVGGQNYRIIRKHSRPKKRGSSGQSSLHLQIANDGGFRAIDGDTMTQTQQKIIDILHMDYNTFTNSAYLRQGHADEFTTANPAKRKEVLSNILGLTAYDEFETRAKDLARQRETLKQQLTTAISEIDTELAQKPASEAELQKAQAESSQIEEAVKQQDAMLSSLRKQKELLEGKRAQLDQLEKNIAERARTLAQWQEQIERLNTRIMEHEALLGKRAEIESGYLKFEEAKNLYDTLNKNMLLSSKLNQKKHELEMFIEQASRTLTKEHAVARSKINELEKAAGELPGLKEKFQQAQVQLQRFAAEEEALRKKKDKSREILTLTKSAESDSARLEKEIKEIEEKLSLLLSQPDTARCPVCDTELGVNGLKHIEKHYNSEKQGKSESLKSNMANITRMRVELKATEEDISQFEKNLSREKEQAQKQSAILEKEITIAEQAVNQLKDELVGIKQIEERLAGKDFALPQQETLKQIESGLDGIDYDPQKYEHVRQQLDSLKDYEASKRRLEEAERLINQERDDIARSENAASELKTGLKTDEQKRRELGEEIIALPQVSADLAQAESEFKNLAVRQKQSQEIIGNIKGKLEYLTRREAEKREKGKQLDMASKEWAIYRELAEAFGQKGIQALLIETALPEIEVEANRLLARMTDNRMHVKIEPLGETQKGKPVETLDIKISDELGTRNYEMFSGGEAFRINFAIRIALSRLLARRAGAPLPTLIIDEGFGTQDAAGIEKLRDAINSIQDDFEKILVITHVEELRDAFPARIDVIKTADGSIISLN